jgi:hypothetical protein
MAASCFAAFYFRRRSCRNRRLRKWLTGAAQYAMLWHGRDQRYHGSGREK